MDEQAPEMGGRDGVLKHWYVKVLLAAVFAVYCGLAAPERITSPADSALYVGLARNMISGAGYSWNYEPHKMVPPVYPAMVAGVMSVFGENYLAINLLSTVAAFLAFLGTWALIEEFSGDFRMGATVAVLCGSTVVFFIAASSTLTDMVYTALALFALLAGWRWIRDTGILSPSGVACILLSAMVCLTRYIGVAVIAAVAIGVVLSPGRVVRGKRMWAKVCVYLALVLFPIACWHVRNRVVAPEAATYRALSDPLGLLTAPTVVSEGDPALTVGEGLIRAGIQRPCGFLTCLGRNMVNLPGSRFWSFWLGVGMISLFFLLASLRSGYNILFGYCACTAGIYVLMSRPLDRYVLPLLPFGFFFLLSGVGKVSGWVLQHRRGRLFYISALLACCASAAGMLMRGSASPVLWRLSPQGLLGLGLCLVGVVVVSWLRYGDDERCGVFLRHAPSIVAIMILACSIWTGITLRLGPLRKLPCVAEDHIKGLEWVRENSKPDDAILAARGIAHLVARRRLVYGLVSDGKQLWLRLKEGGVRYIIVHAPGQHDKRCLIPAVSEIRDRLILRKRFGKTTIYEVKPNMDGGTHETSVDTETKPL